MSSLTFGDIPAHMDNPAFWGMGQYCSGQVKVTGNWPLGSTSSSYCPQFGFDTVTGAQYALAGYFIPTGYLTGYYLLVAESVVTGGGALLFSWQGILQTYGDQSSLDVDTIPWPARAPAWLAFDDSIGGSPGSDTLAGYGGNDAIRGRGGNDIIDGGVGADAAIFAGRAADYRLLSYGSASAVLPISRASGAYAADGTDQLVNVETVRFDGDGAALAVSSAVPFKSFEYIASYADLMQVFGANGAAGFNHYVFSGFAEGRTVSFDGLEYIASYSDLITAFGTNGEAAASHYIQAGRSEGRHIGFDGLEYIASYSDLIIAFGANSDAGASHFIQAGRFEGRHVTFDGLEYIASYPDLINAFHTQVAANPDPDIGANHYIVAGYAELRATDLFDAQQYLAKYVDLQAAFGTDTEAATIHYITAGYFEGRTDDYIV